MKRKQPTKTEKLAAVLLMLKRGNVWLIPEPVRSSGTAAEICSAVEFDHATPFAVIRDRGPAYYNRPQNLTPLPPAAHLEKTRRDVKAIAKGKRITAKAGGRRKGRPIPGSRASGIKKHMDGRVSFR